MSTLRGCSLALTIGWLVGCGGVGLVPVEGTVTLDGKPLAGARVGLELIDGPSDFRLFSGETDSEGRYVIRSFESRSVGAPPGEYRVMIKSVIAPPNIDEMTDLPPDPVPIEYRDGSSTLTVPEEGTTNADFLMVSRRTGQR